MLLNTDRHCPSYSMALNLTIPYKQQVFVNIFFTSVFLVVIFSLMVWLYVVFCFSFIILYNLYNMLLVNEVMGKQTENNTRWEKSIKSA